MVRFSFVPGEPRRYPARIHVLRISTTLKDWLCTGRIGPLSIGDSASDVVTLLGETEHFGPKHRNNFPSCWLYDEIEFGFNGDAKIEWIQSDTIRAEDSRDNPTVIDFDWQGISDGMSMQSCLDWLCENNLTHQHVLHDDGATITVENATRMLLTDADDPKLATIWSPAAQNKNAG